MSPKWKSRYISVVRAALKLHRLQLWTRLPSDHGFQVRVPREEHPLAVALMGHQGEEFGIFLVRGPRAMQDLASVWDEGTDPAEIDIMSVSMVPLRDVGRDLRSIYKKLPGGRDRGRLVPWCLVKPAFRQGRDPDARELDTFSYVLRGLLAAEDQGLLAPHSFLDDDLVQELQVEGDPEAPTVKAIDRKLRGKTASKALRSPAPAELHDLPATAAEWLLGLAPLPACVAGDDRSMELFVALDAATGMAVAADPIMGGDLGGVRSTLINAFHGRGPLKGWAGVPRRFVVARSRRLFEAVTELVAPIGAKVAYVPKDPRLEGFFESAVQFMGRPEILTAVGATVPEDLEHASDSLNLDTSKLPAGTDLEGWKAVDAVVVERIRDEVERSGQLDRPRPYQRYFGDEDTGQFILSRKAGQGVLPAFTEWVAVHYRGTRRSRTIVEAMLMRGVPAAEAAILEARAEAPPSLYRVTAIEPGDHLTLLDVVTGREDVVHDRMMSLSAREGLVLPLCVYRAGSFHFASPIGPPLGLPHLGAALTFLADLGLEPTPQGLAEQGHLLGRLWEWRDRFDARGIALQNTDGDPLLPQTATFEVGDEAALRTALRARDDIDEERPGLFVWDRLDDPRTGRCTLLARLELVANELIVTTNSEKRLGLVRAWLDAVPGMRFVSVRTDPVGASPPSSPPLDDQGPSEPLPPELIAALRAEIESRYMAWIDEPLPMFNNRTPREVARDPDGAARVATLIRSLSAPTPFPEIEVPAAAMLAELGVS